MKAYLLKEAGKPETLKISEALKPTPKDDEVLIKTEALGINYAEILSRKGQYQWAPKKPYIPGMEAFGTIEALGKNVTSHKVGDQVICGMQYGSYAEYICTKEWLAFPGIKGFTAEENAALLVNFMTAWVALVKLGRVTSGERVLIHAGAGGVGSAAIKLAKAMGCQVYATAGSDDKVKLMKTLGADIPINYRKEEFDQYLKDKGVDSVDFVLEVVGGEVFRKSIDLLAPFGRLVVAGYASIPFKKWNPLTWWQTWKDAPKAQVMDMAKKSIGLYATHIGYLTSNETVSTQVVKEMYQFVAKHKLKPLVGKTFTFDQMSEAHAYMESRRSVGKIIVKF
ncbi:MAG: zinc-binding alcohol dehydrogenase family protein [Bacteroidota bacterium]